jgi:hypothetical protein
MRSQDITQMQHKQKRSIIILGIVSYLIGIALMFNVHVFSRDTYISENALQPGSTNYYYDVNDYDFSVRVARDYIKVQKSFAKYISNEQWSRATASWLASRIRELGVEVYEEEFAVSSDSSMNSSSVTRGWNVIGIVRAPRGDGVEILLFTTRYSRYRPSDEQLVDGVSNVGFVISLLRFFSRQNWLSKDYIFVLSPECYGERGLREWLDDYFSLKSLSLDTEMRHSVLRNVLNLAATKPNNELNVSFHGLRGSECHYSRGNIVAALNFNFESSKTFDDFILLLEGTSGHLPNLDLVNVITEVGWNLRVTDIAFSKPYPLLNTIKSYFPSELHTLVTFVLKLAIGIPEDDHAILSQYNIDSLTVTNSRTHNSLNGRYNFWTIARVMEGAIRSLNNLIERFHQSFYYYLLVREPSALRPTSFVSIGYYMIPFGLILLGFFGYSTFTLFCAAKEDLIFSLVNVLPTQLIGVLIFGFPLIVRRLHNWKLVSVSLTHPQTLTLLWATFSFFSVVLLFGLIYPLIDYSLSPSVLRKDKRSYNESRGGIGHATKQNKPPSSNSDSREEQFSELIECLKCLAMVPSCLFLSTFSLFNFAFCALVASVYVPFFSGILFLLRPKPSTANPFQYISRTTSVVVTLVATIVFMFRTLQLPPLLNLIDVMIQSYENYTTLFYPFVTLVVIPFILMLLRVLFVLLSHTK